MENIIAKTTSSSIYIRNDQLGFSLGGNSLLLITITSSGTPEQIAQREIIVFSARVHPGESNASWIMHGILRFLTSVENPQAIKAREMFVFKLIPMLNPDGVINGSHRCSLAGVDLNRVWNYPLENLHPTIFHAKGLIQYMVIKFSIFYF